MNVAIAFPRIFVQTWWVILFVMICFLAYEKGMRTWDKEYAKLNGRYRDLKREKQLLGHIQDDLLLQINSQSDPAWVELVLMKGLGLVPEGQTKVYFEVIK